MLQKNQGLVVKNNYYYSNGSGRDTYILHNSGGNTISKGNGFRYDSSKFLKTSTGFGPRVFKPQAKEKVPHYHSNGHGRDKYIICNSGGLLGDWKDQKSYFRNSLRNSELEKQYFDIPRQLPKQNDNIKRRQRLQSAKLSQPKLKVIPFQNYVDRAVTKEQKYRIRIQKDKEITSNYC